MDFLDLNSIIEKAFKTNDFCNYIFEQLQFYFEDSNIVDSSSFLIDTELLDDEKMLITIYYLYKDEGTSNRIEVIGYPPTEDIDWWDWFDFSDTGNLLF